MDMVFDKPIEIQKYDEDTRDWLPHWMLHAHVNKTKGDEYSKAGSERSVQTLRFTVRYFKAIAEIQCNTQDFRIVFGGNVYNVVDYDDYAFMGETVKLVGESYG